MTMPPRRLAVSMSTWVRSRAWEFSKVTSKEVSSWPMSKKCWRTAFSMDTSRKLTPSSWAMRWALDMVRLVVPKQGMDRA